MQGGARGTRPPVGECIGWEGVLGGGAGAGTPADAGNGRREQWETWAMTDSGRRPAPPCTALHRPSTQFSTRHQPSFRVAPRRPRQG